jgi:DNA invertase Pin-like site-specific DNA recombinase
MAEVISCSLYARVSTKDKGQDPENQLLQLRAFAASKGWRVAKEYEDRESAGGGKVRHAYNQLFEDAASPRRNWDLLLFWSLDRFSREGVYETLYKLKELDNLGVRFLSHQEQYLDTLGPFREAVMAILAVVAKIERQRISERVKAGIARKKLEGHTFGRKPHDIDISILKRMAGEGYSLANMAAALRVSRTTILRRLRSLGLSTCLLP